MVKLCILGSPGLWAADGREVRSVLQQPRRLALLSYLALSETGGYTRRDQLLGLLWPETDESHARAALSVALSRLRSSLGSGVLVTRGVEEVGLAADRFQCDAVAFQKAFDAGDWAGAADVYSGPLLDGFVLDNGPDFDQWLESQRNRFQRNAVDCLGRLADQAWEADDGQARRWAERAYRFGPLDDNAARRMLRILGSDGHRGAAIELYEEFVARLAAERGIAPSPKTAELATRIREATFEVRSGPEDGRGFPGAMHPASPSSASVPVRRTASVAGNGVEEVGPPRSWQRVVPLGLAVAVGLVLGLSVGAADRDRRGRPSLPVAVAVPVSDSGTHVLGGQWDRWPPSRTAIAYSPSGHLLAYVARLARRDGISHLYVRTMRTGRIERIAGTEGAASPFFSPDGAWIGYFMGSALKRLSTRTGEVDTVVLSAPLPEGPRADVDDIHALGATWGTDGFIVFAGTGGLYRVPEHGGEVELLVDRGEVGADEPLLLQPHFAADERKILFQVMARGPRRVPEIHLLDLESGSLRVVVEDAADAAFIDPGRLLFVRRGVLMGVQVDEDTRVVGEAVPLVQDVMQSFSTGNSTYETGAAQYAVSAAGHMAYARGGVPAPESTSLVRFFDDGDEEAANGLEFAGRGALRISPDGSKALLHLGQGPNGTMWLVDLESGTRRLVAEFASDPVWSPDGTHFAFMSREDLKPYVVPSDGSASPRALFGQVTSGRPLDWSVDGLIAYLDTTGITVRPLGGGEPSHLAAGDDERDAVFSPDGAWMAYVSTVSGRPEVYVAPVPALAPARVVSNDGGVNPAWSPGGERLYYVELSSADPRHLMAVDVQPGESLEAARPIPLFPWRASASMPARSYDVAPDGSFLAVVPSTGPDPARLPPGEYTLVLNFADQVAQRLPR
jgi:DNA-binding SARP family transcriptional activator